MSGQYISQTPDQSYIMAQHSSLEPLRVWLFEICPPEIFNNIIDDMAEIDRVAFASANKACLERIMAWSNGRPPRVYSSKHHGTLRENAGPALYTTKRAPYGLKNNMHILDSLTGNFFDMAADVLAPMSADEVELFQLLTPSLSKANLEQGHSEYAIRLVQNFHPKYIPMVTSWHEVKNLEKFDPPEKLLKLPYALVEDGRVWYSPDYEDRVLEFLEHVIIATKAAYPWYFRMPTGTLFENPRHRVPKYDNDILPLWKGLPFSDCKHPTIKALLDLTRGGQYPRYGLQIAKLYVNTYVDKEDP